MSLGRSILLGIAILSILGGTAQAADRWYEVDTAHARVLSDTTPTRTAEIAGQLEAFRVALDRTWRGLTRPLTEPVTVFAFKDDATFDAYKGLSEKPGERVMGVTTKDEEGFVIALDVTQRQNIENARLFKSFQFPYAAAFHEYTHHLLGTTISKLPVWVNEGMAEYASSFVIVGGHADLGRPRYAVPEWLKEGFPLAPDTLFHAASFNALAPRTKSIAYLESWILVFYLTQKDGPRANQFGAFLSGLSAGQPEDEALANAFHA